MDEVKPTPLLLGRLVMIYLSSVTKAEKQKLRTIFTFFCDKKLI